MASHKQSVLRLLAAYQASLYNHLISMSQHGQSSESRLGHTPFPLEIEPLAFNESGNLSEQGSEQLLGSEMSFGGEAPGNPLIDGLIAFKVVSQRNDLINLELRVSTKSVGKPSETEEVVEDAEYEYEDEDESGGLEEDSLPEIVPAKPTPIVRQLYAEVKAITYSQGGDGFTLHAGDIVSVVQFIEEYGMAECRWQGLQGLFPTDKLKVLTKPVESMPSSLYQLAHTNLFQVRTPSNADSLFQKKSIPT